LGCDTSGFGWDLQGYLTFLALVEDWRSRVVLANLVGICKDLSAALVNALLRHCDGIKRMDGVVYPERSQDKCAARDGFGERRSGCSNLYGLGNNIWSL